MTWYGTIRYGIGIGIGGYGTIWYGIVRCAMVCCNGYDMWSDDGIVGWFNHLA